MAGLMIRALFLATALSGIESGAQSQTPYPTRPITMVAPFAAGGPTDVMGRSLSK